VPALFVNCPTAVQVVVEGQDTAPKLADCAPVGFGVVWIDQLVPFQRSAKVT
jgi:hypothetical protein